jgi:hypothetical protein
VLFPDKIRNYDSYFMLFPLLDLSKKTKVHYFIESHLRSCEIHCLPVSESGSFGIYQANFSYKMDTRHNSYKQSFLIDLFSYRI